MLVGSVPVTDTFRVGGTVARFDRDGLAPTSPTATRTTTRMKARLSAEWAPNAKLFVRIAGDTTVDDSNAHGHRLTGGDHGAPVLSNVYDSAPTLTTVLGHKQQVKQPADRPGRVPIERHADVQVGDRQRQDTSYAPIDFDAFNKVTSTCRRSTRTNRPARIPVHLHRLRVQGVAGAYYLKANAYNKFDVRFRWAPPRLPRTMSIPGPLPCLPTPASISIRRSACVGRRPLHQGRAQGLGLRQIYLGTAGSPGMASGCRAVPHRHQSDQRGTRARRQEIHAAPVGGSFKASKDQTLYASASKGFGAAVSIRA